MYSLYRAWLSLGPCGSMPSIPPALPPSMPAPLNLSIPTNQVPGAPDVTLQVGPGSVQFAAHKGILAAYSGFFKAALANNTGIQKHHAYFLQSINTFYFRFHSDISS